MRIQVRTQYASLEGRHPDLDPVPNTHIVSLDWTRLEFALKLPLSPRTEMELQIPYDIKDIEARYELPDGTPFDNPAGNLHHRTEKLEGVSDFKLYWNFALGDWRLSAGLNLPVGKIEDNPYALAALGLAHQHVQFGTGTCDPLARVSKLFHVMEGVDFNVTAGAQIPIVENRKGYRGPPMVDASAGPRFMITDWLSLHAAYSFIYQGRAFWDGDPDPNTGYVMQGFHVSLPVRIGGVTIVPSAYRSVDVSTRDEGDAFEVDWIVSFSVEFPLGGIKSKTEEKVPESNE